MVNQRSPSAHLPAMMLAQIHRRLWTAIGLVLGGSSLSCNAIFGIDKPNQLSDPRSEPNAPTAVAIGDPCEEEGSFICARIASAVRYRCEHQVWIAADPCDEGELCAAKPSGECRAIPEECKDRQPGESFCTRSERTTCADDLLSSDSVDCESAQHCEYGSGAKCATCLPKSFQCEGSILKQCNDSADAFVEVMDCASVGKPCSETAGECSEFHCKEEQKRCTEEGVLEVCNSDRSAFETLDDCAEDGKTCDSQNLECDVCIANERSCSDDGKKVECSANGQKETANDCDPETPFCVGDGHCVECKSASTCEPSSDCSTATCDNNKCGQTPRKSGLTCSTGLCDGEGSCVECLADTDCPSVDECYQRICDQIKHECGQRPRPRATACSGGNVCDGAGACVANDPYSVGNSSSEGWEVFAVNDDEWWVVPVYIPRNAQLLELRIHGASASGAARMAVWESSIDEYYGTAPGVFLTQTNDASMKAGIVSLTPVIPAELTAGRTYWLGAKFTGNAEVYKSTSTENAWNYVEAFSATPLTTMNPFPSGAAAPYPGVTRSFYLMVQDIPQ